MLWCFWWGFSFVHLLVFRIPSAYICNIYSLMKKKYKWWLTTYVPTFYSCHIVEDSFFFFVVYNIFLPFQIALIVFLWDHLFFLLHTWECKWSPFVGGSQGWGMQARSRFLEWISTRVTKGLKHLSHCQRREDDGVIPEGPEWSGVASSSSALQPLGHSVDQLIMFQFTSF